MKLSAESNDFPKILQNKVTREPFFWFFTPKVFNDKPFTGKFEKSNFDLSLNSYFKSFKWMRIKGHYKKKSKNLYLIEYDVDTSKGTKIFTIVVFIIFFSFVNIMFYQNNNKIEILPNTIALVFLLWYFLVTAILKRIARKKFESEFNLIKK